MSGNDPLGQQPEVRYDLAGNPLPSHTNPYATPPPVPPPIAPGMYSQSGQPPAYGQPAPYGQPPTYGQPGAYQPGPQSYRPAQPAIPVGMEEAVAAGANWIIGIALLTLLSLWLNCLSYPIAFPYVSYAGLSGIIESALIMGGFMHYPMAAAIGTGLLIPIIGLGAIGHNRATWVFVVAMIIYGIDIPLTLITWIMHFSIMGVLLGTAWHGWVFSRIFAAFTACREISGIQSGNRY